MKTKSIFLTIIAFTISFVQHSTAQDVTTSADYLDYLNNFDEKQRKMVIQNYYQVRDYFEEGYEKNPEIPRGVLEAIAFQYSRFCTGTTKKDLEFEDNDHGMPHSYSIMGLTTNGKGVFRENAKTISEMSCLPVNEIINNNRMAVLAYASAFAQLQKKYRCYSDTLETYSRIFVELCELPISEDGDFDFAMNSFLYMIYAFLADEHVITYGIPRRSIDLEKIFGRELETLQSSVVRMDITNSGLSNSGDYSGAVYNPAASCNYTTGRGGVEISSITIHYTQGSYAGSIAWFKNCASKVSSHYIIRSFDGQVTQMVREKDKAWHVGVANSYTIGIEHEAMGDIASYFTSSMYQASAELVKDICTRRNINPHRVFYRDTLDDGTALNDGVNSLGGATACTQIRGHQHYPNQNHTDPGKFWDWNLYYKLINPEPQITVYTDSSGTFTDSGGFDGDYGNDERTLYAIHVDGADSISINFSQFDLEPNYDFVWIYNGSSVFSPLIGRWNTQSPGNIVATGEDVLIEFRSDCATTAAGWTANWHAFRNGANLNNESQEDETDNENNGENDTEELPDDNDIVSNDNTPPVTAIHTGNSEWTTTNFTASFSDNDDRGIKWRFYQIIESDGAIWSANHRDGFICDNFDYSLNQTMWVNNYTNQWKVLNGELCQTNSNVEYSGIAARINGAAHEAYLYDFYLRFNSGGKCSFFFNCNNAPSLTSIFSGYEICFSKSDKTVSLYRIILGAKRLLKKAGNIAFANNTNYLYRVVFDNVSGEILLKRHANTIFKITDGVLSTTPYSYIGFATSYASANIDNLRVYGSRGNTVFITVGANEDCNIRTQAINGTSLTKLKSIVIDKAYKLSSLVEKKLFVDYTPPATISNLTVNEDIITLSNGNVIRHLNASWNPSSDNQSGIKRYLHINSNWPLTYANYWNDNGLSTYCNHCYTNSGDNIKFSVIAENKAGLRSGIARCTVDTLRTSKKTDMNASKIDVKATDFNISLKSINKSQEKYRYFIYDISGRKLSEGFFVDYTTVSIRNFAKGTYIVKIDDGKDYFETHKVVNL